MNTYSIIKQKQKGIEHNPDEIKFLIEAFINKKIPDYQMSAWLMATYFKGMSEKETILYTKEIINSGKKLNFNHIDSNKIIDKHSTGGVGDKVSFILGPILAACGYYVPMIAGRGLGHTGGTIDKLESIPGYKTSLKLDTFKSIVEKVGISIMAQTEEICPADKLIYSLRDLTGTIESMPLICGSILSKKIAEGIKILMLDVKYGNGAFMDSIQKAKQLGTMLKKIGENFDIKVYPLYTSMNEPLGNACGLWCEIQESIETLKGNGPKDLTEVVKYLAIQTLKKTNYSNSENLIDNVIKNGKALKIFYNMIEQHSGKINTLDNNKINKPKFKKSIVSKHNGVITTINTKKVGISLIELGAGRKVKNDKLDNSAGIIFKKKCNSRVKIGDQIATIFCSNKNKLERGSIILENSISLSNKSTKLLPLINKG